MLLENNDIEKIEICDIFLMYNELPNNIHVIKISIINYLWLGKTNRKNN